MSAEGAYLRALTALMFAAVCAWLGSALFSPAPEAGESVRAEYMELCDSLPLEGIALRSEIALRGEAVLPGDARGSRLPAGTAVSRRGEELFLSPASALYFDDCDGFEYLSPELAGSLDAATLRELMERKPRKDAECFGRLVTGRDWYFAAFAPKGSAPETGACRLDFGGGLECTARLISVRDTGDSALLIFRLTAETPGLLRLRKCAASLILSDHGGLAVPEEAIFTDGEGNEFVYTCTAAGVERAAVERIYESGRLCLVHAPEGGLSPGSRVLLDAADPG